jgi:single-stranded-DNA-specific exonuclease
MSYKWIMRPVEKPEAVEDLRIALNNIPHPLARTLVLRGIHSFEEAKTFFRPSLALLHDPFLMKDMDKAANRVQKAIQDGEKVLVYGDYDVDGTTSAAMMTSFLRQQGVEANFFIPDRYGDGYGLGKRGLDEASALGATLVIALDCGITGQDAAEYAKSLGLDLVICDHHTAEEILPDAVAVLDPKRPDCEYPFKELTGCGVGFKLIQAVLQLLDQSQEEAYQFLDLLSLSIASDIVPVSGENRLLMTEGLRRLKSEARIGLRMLATSAGLDLENCSTSQIVFGLGPRINAAGRMKHAKTAVDLMMATDASAARLLASELEMLNHDRRSIDKKTFEEAQAMVESQTNLFTDYALVIHKPDWHLGIVGIVASRLVEKYNRPVILMGSNDGYAKGSARSIAPLSIYDAIKSCEDILIKFGGHSLAAGVSIKEEHIDAFRQRINQAFSDMNNAEQIVPEIAVDAPLNLQDINQKFWRILEQFQPFGPENDRPVFMGENLQVTGNPTIVGDGHLKFKVKQKDSESAEYDVIGFNMHEHLPTVNQSKRTGTPIELIFTVTENTWNGNTTLQLQAKDLRMA